MIARPITHSLITTVVFICSFISSVYADDIKLKCAGCKTAAILMKELSAAYPAASFTPGKTGNKKALQLFEKKKIDFAFSCKPAKKLIAKFGMPAETTSSWTCTAFAKDPIVVVVNPKTGITDLSLVQLTKIFTGAIKNWKELGGADLPIEITMMDMNKVETGNTTVFKECTLQKYVQAGSNTVTQTPSATPNKSATITAPATLLDSPDKLGTFCKAKSGGITFMGLNSYKDKYGTRVSIGGVPATVDTIISGKYPMAVTYYLIYGDNAPVKAFCSFATSKEGKEVINKNFVAIK